MRALTVAQPHAEAIIRGMKLMDHREGPTDVRGRVYVYASEERVSDADEEDWLQEYELGALWIEDLPRGKIVGIVELWDCTPSSSGYTWHYRLPERLPEPLVPKHKPLGIWFNPF